MSERESKTSTVPVVLATSGIFSARAIQIISCRDWWPWMKPRYITMIRRQSYNEWSGSVTAHPTPKFPSANIRWKIWRLYFFVIKKASSSLIILQRAKLSTRSITQLCWCGNVTKVVLFLHDNAPTQWAFATQKKLAYLGFQCIDHPPYSPDLAPSDNHLFSGLKNNWKVAIFRPTRRSLLPRRPGWTDNLLIFWVACKRYSNGLRSVLNFVGSILNKIRVWSL